MTDKQPRFSGEFRDELVTLFKWRRSVRQFFTDPVPEELVESLLALMQFAPSVGNSQPWRVVSDPRQRTNVFAAFDRADIKARERYSGERLATYDRLNLGGFKDAPVQLAIFTDMNPSAGHAQGRHTMPETLVHSTICAIHTLWLAARSHGLGLAWITSLEPSEIERIYAVPVAWRFTAYICLGWPREEQSLPELETSDWQKRSKVEDYLHSA